MKTQSHLKGLLQPLLAALEIKASELETANSYVFQLARGLTLQIEENPERYLTLSCALPVAEERKNDIATAWLLLQTNLLGLEHPPILTAALAEEKMLILWARQPFSELDAIPLQRLFDRFIAQAESLAAWLKKPVEEIKKEQSPQQHVYGDFIQQQLNSRFQQQR